jgi:hypothetical protein
MTITGQADFARLSGRERKESQSTAGMKKVKMIAAPIWRQLESI